MIKQMETHWWRSSAEMCLLVLAGTAAAAASFQNLDFQSANVGNAQGPQFLPVGNALPGWGAYIGGEEPAGILYRTTALGSAAIELRDDMQPNGAVNYAVMFYSGGSPDGVGPGVPSGLYQSGDIPAEAKTLLFQGDGFAPDPNVLFRVSVDGVTLSLQPVDGGTLGADISAFAGKTAELRFQANWLPERAFPQVYFPLDNIRFSDVALVPEPETWALLGGGSLFVLGACCRTRR